MSSKDLMQLARTRLEQAVTEGTRRAGPVIQSVMNDIPEDSIVRANAMNFESRSGEKMHIVYQNGTGVSLHENAEVQLLERLGGDKFRAFARQLRASESSWQHEILEYAMTNFAAHSNAKYLVRSAKIGSALEARAVLSDRFRRLDSRPMLDAFIGASQQLGMVPYDGVHSSLSASVRAILPTIYEPVPGEALVFGLAWTNSDYGKRNYAISMFVLRLVCLNGMIGANQLKQVHLGGKLDDSIEFSRKTYELDTQTMISATQDLVRGALGQAKIDEQVEMIRRAASASEGDLHKQMATVAKVLTKDENKRVVDAFEGADVINLPAGKTPWRLSNALSWVANEDKVSAERKIEMQELAGKVVS